MKSRFFILLSLFSLVLPTQVGATEVVYPSAVAAVTLNVLSSTYALGAPDNLFTDFRAADASVSLDMGEDVSGDITLTYRVFDGGAQARVEMLSADGTELQTSNTILSLIDDSYTITYTGETDFRYIKITCVESETWSVDAVGVEVDSTVEEPAGDNTVEPPTVEETAGMLLKIDTSPAVYVLGLDGKRHAFPNESIFHSWFASFDDVVTVDATTLASYKLGASVTVRPGTYLVKLTTDPKTYAVEPNGELRWITSESVAVSLYGSAWASRVLDLPDTLWPSYSVGADISTAVHPDGSVLADRRIDGTDYWYIINALRLEISAADFATLQFDGALVIDDTTDALSLYVDGGDFTLANDVQYPY